MQRREIFKISHFSSAGWTDMYCGCSWNVNNACGGSG
jgi:hypothetical protein